MKHYNKKCVRIKNIKFKFYVERLTIDFLLHFLEIEMKKSMLSWAPIFVISNKFQKYTHRLLNLQNRFFAKLDKLTIFFNSSS